MSWVTKYPERHSDPVSYMIDVVAEEAVRDGRPLTSVEREHLRLPSTAGLVPDADDRLDYLVTKIVRHEFETGAADDPASFVSALGWIETSGGSTPFVGDLASCAVRAFAPPKSQLRDAMSLLASAFILVLAIAAVGALVIAIIEWVKK